MKKFYPLKVLARKNETRDSVRLCLEVPEDLREQFQFLAGQHLPVRVLRDGKTLRRTYSICSEPGKWPLEIGIRIQPGGQFSQYADKELKTGDSLEVMPPFGQFHVNPDAPARKFHVAFAAGSGITPIISIIAATLAAEPSSRFLLFYGNRRQTTTMFIDDLYGLKNRYLDRLQLHFIFSQEEQEFAIASGRLDGDKVRELMATFCSGVDVDEAFICGPDSMITDVSAALAETGLDPASIHAERFGAPRKLGRPRTKVAASGAATITIIMDGHKKTFEMDPDDDNIVDAAASHGIDLPYSCKGGVCATCRCHVRKGEVSMAANYGLEPWEVDAGFALACQSRPVSRALTLDYDKT